MGRWEPNGRNATFRKPKHSIYNACHILTYRWYGETTKKDPVLESFPVFDNKENSFLRSTALEHPASHLSHLDLMFLVLFVFNHNQQLLASYSIIPQKMTRNRRRNRRATDRAWTIGALVMQTCSIGLEATSSISTLAPIPGISAALLGLQSLVTTIQVRILPAQFMVGTINIIIRTAVYSSQRRNVLHHSPAHSWYVECFGKIGARDS